MNQRIKRFLSLLMVCTMLFGMMVFPTSAAETDVPTEETLETETEAATEEVTEAPTEEATEAPTEESTEPPTEEPSEEPTEGSEEEAVTPISGDMTITAKGTYQLAEGVSGTIVVATTEPVTIIGNGAKWDESFTMTSTVNSGLYIDCTTQAGVKLTLQDVFINNTSAVTGVNGDRFGLIGFTGTGNTLNFEGINVVEYQIAGGNNPGGIHVKQGDSLIIGGNGTLYFYKTAQGSGIGGSSGELNGDITFQIANMFAKGSKQGALIGAGSASAGVEGAPGSVSFVSGNYNLVSVSRGAVIGGSAGSTGGSSGTTVYVGPKANININVDYSGAAVGGGGYAEGNDSSGGTLYVTGGSLRTYIDSNAANSATKGWNGKPFTQGVNDAAITAQRLNAEGEAVYMLAFDTAQLATAASSFKVFVDGSETAFYEGGLSEFGFVQEALDKSNQIAITSTVSNWYKNGETNLYFYLTGKDHTLNVNGETFIYYWDEVNETFSTVDKAVVTFNVTPADADIVISDGIGYTYLENTHQGKFFEAVEADEESGIAAEAAVTKFSLAPGEYTFTITKDGYYASTGSFKVSDDLHAVSIASSSNINSYLKDDVFTIPMTVFTKSANEGAWDGVTIDVSWYSETAAEMHISTPAQLAGLAAIVNGIYNAEITTIIDDMNGDGVTETYTPYDYAHLEGRKIIAANSGGSTGSNNLVTTSTYWYGAKSEGTYTSGSTELAMPSDFRGQTVYLDCDLDMGGYQVDGVWAGARYMTIGGQSLMHYIEYGAWMSDGYSHIGSSFNGTLDGQGHIVKNMYCDRYATGSNYGDSVSVALVGRLGNHDGDPAEMAAVDPTVRNIAVTGYVYGRRSVGGIVGKTGHTSASKVTGDTSTGAIIENCVNFAQVKNTDAKGVGGICGAGWNAGVIRNCANFGTIYAGRSNAGGICGSCEMPVINCYNAGYVDAISYSQGQAIGTDNGGAVYTNVYWLAGSSIADSNDTYQYPAVYRHDSKDTLVEVESFDDFKTADFLVSLNGNYRDWVFTGENDAISTVLAGVAFQNCKLDTTGVTAAGFPVPRCFITDTTTVTSIEKIADPENLSYVAGQTFDPTGIQIKATWSDGTTELLEDYTVSITCALETTDTTVTISGTRGGVAYSFDFAITVVANELNTLEITTKPSNILYAQGEEFDPTGMVVKATYTVAPTTKVTLDASEYTYTVEGNIVTVSYTFGDKTLTATVELTILDTPAPTPNESGSYQLYSSNDVLWFANQVKAYKLADLNAVVMNDITVADSFPGIGTSSTKYAGTFDGQGYTLTLNMNVYATAGFFTYVSGGTIKNVTVAGSITNESSSSGIAGIAGYVDKAPTTIENCVNLASINGAGYAGGIVGKTYQSQLTINGCTNKGTVTASNKYAGGIVGYLVTYSSNEAGSSVADCVNYGAVTGTNSIGGIAGEIKSASASKNVSITRCGNEAAIAGTYDVGGIVGYCGSASDRISSCYNMGDIQASSSSANHGVGGIVGLALAHVENVYNQGDVTASDETAPATFGVGGIIGTIGSHYVKTQGIVNAYNAGTVTGSGEAQIGALAGYIRYTSVLTNCHYLEGSAYGSIYGSNTVTGEPTVQTAAQLQALAETLGEEFKAGHPCYEEGFPMLVWQADPTADHLNNHSYNADGFCDGCGVYNPEASAYTVRTAANLKAIADAVNAGDTLKGKTVTLASNISLADYASWEPIGGAAENVILSINSQEELTAAIEQYNMIYDDHGNSYKYGTDKNMTYVEGYVYYYVSGQIFSGTFDGAGYFITDLSVNASTGYAGFFGNVDGTVKNFTISGSVSSTANNTDFVGGVAGKLSEGGTIQGVTANVTVTANKCYNVGGIVGFLGTKDATASNKFTSANNTFVIECVNNGSVTGYSQVGGITGENAGQIQRCVNTGTVNALKTGSKAGIGGIAGRNGCNNNAYTMGTIVDCYNTGAIGSSSNKWVGGVTGFSNAASIVRNCYNVGTVYGAGQANALVGQGEAMPATYTGAGVYNCWFLDSTKVFDASGVYGGHYEDCGSKTEAEMKDPAFAAILGSSFNVDSANVNNGYPVLKFQGGTAAPAIYTVIIPASGEGYTVSIADGYTTTVVEGGEFKFSIYLLDGYRVVSVKAGETELTAVDGVYTVENITSDVTVAIDVQVIPDTLMGDTNGDGSINIFDLVVLQNYLADDTVEIDLDAADINGDGIVNIYDLVALQNLLAEAE